MTSLRNLAVQLFEIGCFKHKRQSPDGAGFRLKTHERNPDAPLSPFYLNLRTPDNPKPGPLTDALVTAIAWHMHDDIIAPQELGFTALAGVPRAGNPLADELSDVCGGGYTLLALEKGESQSGRCVGRAVRGVYQSGETVLLVDDLITRADSKLKAIAALAATGLQIMDVVVIVDREQGGKEELRDKGYSLHALFSLTDLLQIYTEEDRISPSERDEILEYVRATPG